MFSVNKNIFGLLLLFLLVYMSSCGSSADGKEQEEQKLEESVLAIHDRVMPKYDKLGEMLETLEKLSGESAIDSIKTQNPSIDKEFFKQRLMFCKKKLSEADDSMTMWMSRYSEESRDKKHSEVIMYLKEQKINLEKIEIQTQSAIDSATALMKTIAPAKK